MKPCLTCKPLKQPKFHLPLKCFTLGEKFNHLVIDWLATFWANEIDLEKRTKLKNCTLSLMHPPSSKHIFLITHLSFTNYRMAKMGTRLSLISRCLALNKIAYHLTQVASFLMEKRLLCK